MLYWLTKDKNLSISEVIIFELNFLWFEYRNRFWGCWFHYRELHCVEKRNNIIHSKESSIDLWTRRWTRLGRVRKGRCEKRGREAWGWDKPTQPLLLISDCREIITYKITQYCLGQQNKENALGLPVLLYWFKNNWDILFMIITKVRIIIGPFQFRLH